MKTPPDHHLEEHFRQIQRGRAGNWIQDRDRVRQFILEIMVLMSYREIKPSWSIFKQTNSWMVIRDHFGPEDQFCFKRLWDEVEQEIYIQNKT